MSEVSSLSLNIGDRVVYPSHGAGAIRGISDQEVLGKSQSYFELELFKGGMQVKVPVVHASRLGLRRVTPTDKLPELLSNLALPDLDLPAAWTPRHRRELTILQEGDIDTITKLVGTLHRRAQGRTLAVTERAILDDAKRIVATEVSVSKQIEHNAAVAEIDLMLEQVIAPAVV